MLHIVIFTSVFIYVCKQMTCFELYLHQQNILQKDKNAANHYEAMELCNVNIVYCLKNANDNVYIFSCALTNRCGCNLNMNR